MIAGSWYIEYKYSTFESTGESISMLAYLPVGKAVKEAEKVIEKDTAPQTLERFRRNKRSHRWSGPVIRGS